MVVAILVVHGFSFGAEEVGAAEIAAPEFSVSTLAGDPYTSAMLKGQPTLLAFWAPWCKVCQRELPVLAEFAQHEKPPQLRILSIGFADSRGNVEEFVKARRGAFVFPTAYDDNNQMARSYRINATPTFVLVNDQGYVVLVHRGGGLLQNVQFRELLSTLKG
jgi:thiol-disulfide isomerase/thioredoxin